MELIYYQRAVRFEIYEEKDMYDVLGMESGVEPYTDIGIEYVMHSYVYSLLLSIEFAPAALHIEFRSFSFRYGIIKDFESKFKWHHH